ncbi:hypothetical protein [Pannonibacter phragmitetus]|uniref:hypothetical protein n=1 Tax=Pannonibacter phragmitetus TaxID=121719 RepID=UPI003D2EDFBC
MSIRAALTKWLHAAAISAALGFACAAQPASAQTPAPSVQNEYEAGWINDAKGMRHFTGFRCPNEVGGLTRSKVMPTVNSRIASCIYLDETAGIQVVISAFQQGMARREAGKFKTGYQAAGYKELALSGIAASGITFTTGGNQSRMLCETLWPMSGKNADYTVWIHYSLPVHEQAVEPAFKAVVEMLKQQN